MLAIKIILLLIFFCLIIGVVVGTIQVVCEEITDRYMKKRKKELDRKNPDVESREAQRFSEWDKQF